MNMKTGIFIGAVIALAISATWAQNAAAPAAAVPADTAPTVITSDQFKLDMTQRQGLFTGSVIVTGTDFKMTAGEMTVYFGTDNNRIERLVAKGDVVMEQPNRTAKSSQMEYLVKDDKIILTGSPEVTQDKNHVTGTTISIYRNSNKMDIDGRSRVVLYETLGNSTPAKP